MPRKAVFKHTKELLWEVLEVLTYFHCPLLNKKRPTGQKILLNDGTKQSLGNVSLNYKVLKNEELIKIAKDMEKYLVLNLIGFNQYGGGKKVFAMFSREKVYDLNGLKVTNNVILGNGHGGIMTLEAGSTNFTDTGISFRTTTSSLKIRHDGKMEDKIDSLNIQMLRINDQREKDFKILERAFNTEASDEDIRLAISDILDLDKRNLTPQLETEIADLQNAIERQVKERGQNVWGLYLGIIDYNTKSAERHSHDFPIFGKSGKVDKMAFNMVKRLVSK
jgi:hypothetical protein